MQFLAATTWSQLLRAKKQTNKRIYRQGTGCFIVNLLFYESAESATTEEIRDLYNELEIMTNVGYHPNLVNLLGACTENGLYHLSWLNSFTFALVYLCTLFFNPFTAKCGQRKVSTKFPNFIFQNCEKQIASCESTGTELSFEWSHHRISSTDSKVRVTLQNAIKQSGGERVKMKKIQNCGF